MTHVDTSDVGVLLTGGSGYIGGRLLPKLEERAARLRCISRNPEFLKPRCAPETQVMYADARDPTTLARAMEGMDIAYYLVESGRPSDGLSEADRLAARQFAAAARKAGLRRIIYLGGLGSGDDLSPRLAQRRETGRILRSSGVETIEFRSTVVIGSGSFTFEMIRSVTEKLPIIIAPRWMKSRLQPVSVEDVAEYLNQALDLEADGHRVYEIGGSDQVTLRDMIREYARQRSLHRLIITLPGLTPRLSAFWLTLHTPLNAKVGRRVIDMLSQDAVVRDQRVLVDFPIRPKSLKEAITRALAKEDEEFAATMWSTTTSSTPRRKRYGGVKFGNRLAFTESQIVHAAPEDTFTPIEQIGGERGWYYMDWMWSLRGYLDQLVGGAGSRRGRRDPDRLLPGDTLDFFRVRRIKRNRFLQLGVEMKVPGRAWLQFEVEPDPLGSKALLTAIFDPIGLGGLLYWYSMYPFHALIFKGALREIARRAEAVSTQAGAGEDEGDVVASASISSAG